MASNDVVTLPALRPKVKYNGVPRRYEETKPMVVRDFTHRSILALGNSYHENVLERSHTEKIFAVKAAEEAIWAQAEVIKNEAIKQVIEKTNKEHADVIHRLEKAHKKAVKEEGLRVHSEMQKVATGQVKLAREEGEKLLKKAVAETEKRCHEEKLVAVQKAREEEVQIASNKAVDVAQKELEKFNGALSDAHKEKEKALMELKVKMDNERVAAVATAHRQEQNIAEKRLEEQRQTYKVKLQELRQVIADKKQEILRLEQDLEATIAHKKAIAKELIETRDEFQTFIDKVTPFEKGKSDYLIPPAKSIMKTMERETTFYH